MTLPVAPIPHLLFSTRQARPESSSGFNREIVAESPGVPAPVRRQFDDLADMTGFVLRKPDLPPLWAFRRVGPDAWLVVRAVSLGLYRKGHHQLLAHGLMLRRHHLEWLDGNPFLLDSPEARQAGFTFEETHPEERRELEPKQLDPAFATTAPRLNREVFEELSWEFDPPGGGDGDPALPALHESLLDRERCTAWVPPTHLGEERPDPRFLEWILLHLHPADRSELSFHSWYAYDRPRRFDLVGVARSDAEDLKRHLRGEVQVWDPARPAREAPLGRRVQALRRTNPLHYTHTLETYYLTVLEPRFRPDLRGKSLPNLSSREATLCLRHELGESLDPDEEKLERHLRSRGGSELEHKVVELAAAWERSSDEFAGRWARFREVPVEASPQDRENALTNARTPAERWSLLALLPHADPAPGDEELRQAWERLVPAGSFQELLSLFDSPKRGALAEDGLRPWVEALVTAETPAAEDWPLYLAFLHRHRLPVLPAARRFEEILDAAPAEVRLAGYRELQKVCVRLDQLPFALRLLFQKEVPLLPEAKRRIRVADGVHRLLATEGEADEVLSPALADPVTAEAAFQTLAERLEASPGAETRARCRLLLSRQRQALPAEAVDGAAEFLAGLAATGEGAVEGIERLAGEAALRDRLLAATARRLLPRVPPSGGGEPLFRNVGLLLDLRCTTPGAAQTPGLGEEVDRALLELVFAILVLGPSPRAGAALRRHFSTWLQILLDEGRFPALAARPGEWRHLLLDELLLDELQLDALRPEGEPEPSPAEAAADPRRRAYQLLAWQRWYDASDDHRARAAMAGLLRATGPLGGPTLRRRALESTLPDGWRESAAPLLDFLFSDTATAPSQGGAAP